MIFRHRIYNMPCNMNFFINYVMILVLSHSCAFSHFVIILQFENPSPRKKYVGLIKNSFRGFCAKETKKISDDRYKKAK